MKAIGYMSSGHGRQNSQDRLLIYDTILAKGRFEAEWKGEQRGCLAIFDGVGGIAGGEYASGYAAMQMWNYPIQNGEQMLNSYIQGIGTTLRNRNGCATTASGLLMLRDRCMLFHVGNTRIWTYDGEYLEQITQDQTYIEESGHQLSKEKIEQYGNVITGCLGGNDPSLTDRLCINDVTDVVSKCTALLFTCDGIHDYVDNYDIEKVLQSGSDLSDIVDIARKNGSDDDCSILCIKRK
ncbi:MAG: hypothetical protein Q4C31_03135 [Eubacteriales bacterium]|nr:hypothetical protein [Eubacteriales bacterium]